MIESEDKLATSDNDGVTLSTLLTRILFAFMIAIAFPIYMIFRLGDRMFKSSAKALKAKKNDA